jgi:hypothetical protein
MKILLSIIISLILTAPIFISIFFYYRKKNIKWIYGGGFLTLIATFFIFLIAIEIRIPDNNFNENEFKQSYTNVFQSELPNSVKIFKKEYKREGGLFGAEYWTATIEYNENGYVDLLNYVKKENEMLLQDFSDKPKVDCITGDNIIYSIKTNYMNPWNYEIIFFEDRKTTQIKLTVYGD